MNIKYIYTELNSEQNIPYKKIINHVLIDKYILGYVHALTRTVIHTPVEIILPDLLDI